jgi:DnaK suppressor protein
MPHTLGEPASHPGHRTAMSMSDIAPDTGNRKPSAGTAEQRLACQLEELRRVLCEAAVARLDRLGSDAARPAFRDGSPAASGWTLVDVASDDDDARVLRDVQRCESAMQRLSAGRYGLCIDCDDAIAAARLEASPETERCTACQLAYERGLFAPSRG